MFVVGKANDKIFQYSLADNFDVSTASYASKSCDVSSQDSDGPEGVTFTDDGLKMFVMGNQDDLRLLYTSTHYLRTLMYPLARLPASLLV